MTHIKRFNEGKYFENKLSIEITIDINEDVINIFLINLEFYTGINFSDYFYKLQSIKDSFAEAFTYAVNYCPLSKDFNIAFEHFIKNLVFGNEKCDLQATKYNAILLEICANAPELVPTFLECLKFKKKEIPEIVKEKYPYLLNELF